MNAMADFGDQPIDWTASASSDFRDYALRNLNKRHALNNNFWAFYWLNQKFLELNLHSPKPLDSVMPLNLNSSTINAFALPGNIIGIHMGLWAFANNEDEFLSVLAHEMSHIALDHFTRLTQNQSNQGWTIATGALLAIIFSGENSDIASAALLSSIAAVSQNSLSFSQSMELEADQMAKSILDNTTHDSNAGRQFFQRLDQESGSSKAYEFLRSHPYGTTRASKLAQWQTPARTELPNQLSAFNVIRYFLIKSSDQQSTNPFLGISDLDDTITDPNIRFGWLEYQYQQHNNTPLHIEQLQLLTQKYSAFLPAYYRILTLMESINSPQLCTEYRDFSSLIGQQTLTLDVLRSMSEISKQCQPNTATEWQALLLWQSGKERQALDMLAQQLRQPLDQNQLARIRAKLKQLNQRYERFR